MGIFDWISGKSKQSKNSVVKNSEAEDYFQESFENIDNEYFHSAIENISKAIEIDATKGVYYFNRASIKQRVFDYELAIPDYTKSIDLKFEHIEEAYFNRAMCKIHIQDIKGAKVDAMKLLELGHSEWCEKLEYWIDSLEELGYDDFIKLYTSSLELHSENQEVLAFNFNEIVAIIDLHVGIEIVIREVENYFEKFKENKELTESFRIELKNRFSVIKGEKNLKKQEKLFKEYVDIISSFPTLLMDLLNDFAYNQFEQAKYKEGLNLSAQSISLLKMAFSEDMENQKQELASYLDTFSYGLYLYDQFKDAVRISDISISLSPDDYYISEHYTNRGKSKLKLNDIEGAKLDFEKALDKDEDFEEAKHLLESIDNEIN